MSILRRAARQPLLLVSSFISSFLVAAPALSATPIITLGSTGPSWHLSSSQRLHHSADSLLALGENAVAGRGTASETMSWQQLPPGAGLDPSALSSPPAGFVAGAGMPAPVLYSRAAGNTHLRMTQLDPGSAAATAAASSNESIVQPGLYTMLLIGVGLLLLRIRRNDLHDEKFSV